MTEPAQRPSRYDTGPFADQVRPCMEVLKREQEGAWDVDRQRTLFGLSSDAQGTLNDVCLLATTLPPTSAFLECVAETLLEAPPVVSPNEREAAWTLLTTLD